MVSSANSTSPFWLGLLSGASTAMRSSRYLFASRGARICRNFISLTLCIATRFSSLPLPFVLSIDDSRSALINSWGYPYYWSSYLNTNESNSKTVSGRPAELLGFSLMIPAYQYPFPSFETPRRAHARTRKLTCLTYPIC